MIPKIEDYQAALDAMNDGQVVVNALHKEYGESGSKVYKTIRYALELGLELAIDSQPKTIEELERLIQSICAPNRRDKS